MQAAAHLRMVKRLTIGSGLIVAQMVTSKDKVSQLGFNVTRVVTARSRSTHKRGVDTAKLNLNL